jgi:hypothetical protein
MSNNDICDVLLIDILTGSAGQGLKIGRVFQFRLFLSFVISLKGGRGGGGGGGGARVRRCRKDNADPGHRMIVPLGLGWGVGGLGMKGGDGGEERGNQRSNEEKWQSM